MAGGADIEESGRLARNRVRHPLTMPARGSRTLAAF